MDNIKIEQFNIYVKQIIYIVSFFVIFYIIIDELVRLSKFVFVYKYNYDYGNNLNNICGGNNIEYETGRFQTIHSINDNKLTNDVYNKSNYMLILLIIVLIFTFIICYCFGIYFYNSVIEKNKCFSITDFDNSSVLKQMIVCFLGEKLATNINTCVFYYIILFSIIALIPISILLNIILNFNIYISESFYMPIFIILFISILISRYYVGIDISFITFIIFLIVFISSLIFYKKVFDIYKNYSFSLDDLYTNNQKIFPNKYNNTGDDNFYSIYSNKEPEIPKLIKTDRTYKISSISASPPYTIILEKNGSPPASISVQPTTNPPTEYTDNEKAAYDIFISNSSTDPDIISNYKKYLIDKNIYNEKMREYNEKLDFYNKNNIFKNNNDNLSILDILLTFIGINNSNDISTYILILLGFLVVVIISLFISYNDLLYNVFIIILNIFIIILLINSITTINTYINKYFIYINSKLYKYDISLINKKFSNILDNIKIDSTTLHPIDKTIGNSILYNIYSSMFSYNLINNSINDIYPDSTIVSQDQKNIYHNYAGGDVNLLSIMFQIYRGLPHSPDFYYDIIKKRDMYNANSQNIDIIKSDIVQYNLISGTHVDSGHSGGKIGFRSFIVNNNQLIKFFKNIFLEDISKINNLIEILENNIMVDYNIPTDVQTITIPNIFRKSIANIAQVNTAKKNDTYKNYKIIVNKCLLAYKKFVLDMRDIIAIYLIEQSVITSCSNSKSNIISLPTFTAGTAANPSSSDNLLINLFLPENASHLDKFNNCYRNLVDVLYVTLNYEGNILPDTNNIVSDIINNYNKYNNNDNQYKEKKLKDIQDIKKPDDNFDNEPLYSNDLISNMNNVSNSIYVVVLLSIFAILEPIYI